MSIQRLEVPPEKLTRVCDPDGLNRARRNGRAIRFDTMAPRFCSSSMALQALSQPAAGMMESRLSF